MTRNSARNNDANRIILLEDESLIALDVETLLQDAGYEVTWFASLEPAIAALASGEAFAAGVLDVNIDGDRNYAVADAMAERHMPFLFVSGHAPDTVPPRHQGRPYLVKPYTPAKLLKTLETLVASRAADASSGRARA